MLLRVPRRLRAAAAIVAVAAYALPPLLGVLSQVEHGAQHLLSELQERKRVAEALGLVHLQGQLSAAAPGRFVHSHGGAVHAHDGATGALLLAAEQSDERAEQGHAPSIELSSHVPSSHDSVRLASAVVFAPVAPRTAPARLGSFPPTPPPPRA